MNIIKDKQFDEERALYNLKDSQVVNCVFAGPADGESVLKEARDITVDNCSFSLRYPLWHVEKFSLLNSNLDELTRAPIWYCTHGEIKNTKISSVKALRECTDMTVSVCDITSAEFGWKCNNISVDNCDITSEYIFLDSKNIKIGNLKFKGKYSFQYIENLIIENSILDTKDAFWHSKNVTVKNSVVKGEYLAWFSENLTLINCKISGTQPFCYCKKLKLINCEMIDTDLSFEYSEVEADIKGNILSVKNPKSGYIKADSIGEIISEDSVMENLCEIITETKQ